MCGDTSANHNGGGAKLLTMTESHVIGEVKAVHTPTGKMKERKEGSEEGAWRKEKRQAAAAGIQAVAYGSRFGLRPPLVACNPTRAEIVTQTGIRRAPIPSFFVLFLRFSLFLLQSSLPLSLSSRNSPPSRICIPSHSVRAFIYARFYNRRFSDDETFLLRQRESLLFILLSFRAHVAPFFPLSLHVFVPSVSPHIVSPRNSTPSPLPSPRSAIALGCLLLRENGVDARNDIGEGAEKRDEDADPRVRERGDGDEERCARQRALCNRSWPSRTTHPRVPQNPSRAGQGAADAVDAAGSGARRTEPSSRSARPQAKTQPRRTLAGPARYCCRVRKKETQPVAGAPAGLPLEGNARRRRPWPRSQLGREKGEKGRRGARCAPGLYLGIATLKGARRVYRPHSDPPRVFC
ncbi:hypothetical protein HPB48_018605 [Haemaphysalis longicornis]|uniref:Uncharacterized protein n=1 Tax=Haemaphysalis longicornis TaxID=44386 RepID=A0A9J6H2Z3_HAELO|nr:hypothetical protein HPB48_018605 [Haemaphysalis longicornis]